MRRIVFLLVLGIAGSLLAQEMPVRGPIPFATYDQNGDGTVSETEFYDVRGKRMEQRAQEGRPMRNAGNAPDFTYFDADKNGRLTPQELTEGQNRRMQERRGGMGPGMGGGMGGM